MVNCYKCKHRLLTHSNYITCALCKSHFHVNCLSVYDDVTNISEWTCEECLISIFPFNHYEMESDFKRAVFDSHTGKSQNRLKMPITDKIFNPLSFEDDVCNADVVNNLIDCDPDLNFYNESHVLQNIYNCDYYNEKLFFQKCSRCKLSDRSLSVFQFNIRSMAKNCSSLELYLETLDFEFKIIGLCETWLNASNAHCYNIKDYNIENNYRINKTGGGVSLLLKKEIEYTVRGEFTRSYDNIETILVEISKSVFKTEKNIIVACIYRPPNTIMKDLQLILVLF